MIQQYAKIMCANDYQAYYLYTSLATEEQVKEANRASILDGSLILCDSQHFDLIE